MSLKTFLLLLILIATACHSPSIKSSRNLNCSMFQITRIEQDSTESNALSIVVAMAGQSKFIDYPAIAAVTNSKGDTIATGAMAFYGQISGSSQTYKVVSKLGNFPIKGIYVVHFASRMDDLNCTFPYQIQ